MPAPSLRMTCGFRFPPEAQLRAARCVGRAALREPEPAYVSNPLRRGAALRFPGGRIARKSKRPPQC